MAVPITYSELKKIQVSNYETIRSQLKTGDIYFCAGNYLFSKLIRYFTKSAFSHCGIIYHDSELDRTLFIESEASVGVRMGPFSKYIRDYNGTKKSYKGIVIVVSLQENLSEEERKKMLGFALDELTRPYDNKEIFRILYRTVFGKLKRVKDKNYICSEYVYEAFRKAGIYFQYREKSISPNDIWQDEKVILKWRLV